MAKRRTKGPIARAYPRSGGVRAPAVRPTATQRRRAFIPTVLPTRPPPGTYDPALDAQERASGRGLAQLREDYDPLTGRLSKRLQDDYLLEIGDVDRESGRTLADALRRQQRQAQEFANARADLDLSYTRGSEDYNRALGDLTRNFQRLGSAQTQAARRAGVARGGTLAQALARRTENQGYARQPLDVNYQRMGEDRQTQLARLAEQQRQAQEDYELGTGRVGEDVVIQKGRLGLAQDRLFNPQMGDIPVKLARAGEEASAFGQDLNTTRWFQSRGLFQPPVRPRNEYTRPDPRTGLPVFFRTIKTKRGLRRVLPSGRTVRPW